MNLEPDADILSGQGYTQKLNNFTPLWYLLFILANICYCFIYKFACFSSDLKWSTMVGRAWTTICRVWSWGIPTNALMLKSVIEQEWEVLSRENNVLCFVVKGVYLYGWGDGHWGVQRKHYKRWFSMEETSDRWETIECLYVQP